LDFHNIWQNYYWQSKQSKDIFPPHLINASALPCETENMEIVSFHVNVACWFELYECHHHHHHLWYILWLTRPGILVWEMNILHHWLQLLNGCHNLATSHYSLHNNTQSIQSVVYEAGATATEQKMDLAWTHIETKWWLHCQARQRLSKL